MSSLSRQVAAQARRLLLPPHPRATEFQAIIRRAVSPVKSLLSRPAPFVRVRPVLYRAALPKSRPVMAPIFSPGRSREPSHRERPAAGRLVLKVPQPACVRRLGCFVSNSTNACDWESYYGIFRNVVVGSEPFVISPLFSLREAIAKAEGAWRMRIGNRPPKPRTHGSTVVRSLSVRLPK